MLVISYLSFLSVADADPESEGTDSSFADCYCLQNIRKAKNELSLPNRLYFVYETDRN